jgi:hypothetical protein
MIDKHKKIEEYIENKLRNLALNQPSKDFNKFLMEKITAEYRVYTSEARTDKIIKYSIGSFVAIVIGIIILSGVASKSSQQVEGNFTGINISPAVQTSGNYLDKFIAFIQNIFIEVMGSLGLTISPSTITLFLVGLFVVALFVLGEKFLIKGRLKSARARL